MYIDININFSTLSSNVFNQPCYNKYPYLIQNILGNTLDFVARGEIQVPMLRRKCFKTKLNFKYVLKNNGIRIS